MLSNFWYVTNPRLGNTTVSTEQIISLIRNLKNGKANGRDDISANMLTICDEKIAIPLKLICENILSTSIFPEMSAISLLPIYAQKISQDFVLEIQQLTS